MKDTFLFAYGMCLMVVNTTALAAADSYRYFHVTIETPWAIFIFLLFIVLFPFVLMAILYWYFAYKKQQQKKLEVSDVGGK